MSCGKGGLGGRRKNVFKKYKIQNNTWVLFFLLLLLFFSPPSWCVFNAPKLPGGMNLWLSPSGRSPHLHLLSNLLKNAPERKKQKEPFRHFLVRALDGRRRRRRRRRRGRSFFLFVFFCFCFSVLFLKGGGKR